MQIQIGPLNFIVIVVKVGFLRLDYRVYEFQAVAGTAESCLMKLLQ